MTEQREDFVDTDYAAPEGELEQAVAGISAEVLGVDRVGRTDSYYDFGTTSLQAVRICARIHRLTGVQALPVWLFDNDVLADFVQRLTAAGADGEGRAAARPAPTGNAGGVHG
ncbi:phosphopantetheine-binding protein [Rhizomonospora bruguierae]|uniref:phosphopantetheine-binding protein n=1 Tax=Rhizomonospora bruguierae TaxID=1581705 RepID=UPI001BCC6A43|nr:phosphopantetheine-binding protein [Micromonospora sp. NBRC 107566]